MVRARQRGQGLGLGGGRAARWGWRLRRAGVWPAALPSSMGGQARAVATTAARGKSVDRPSHAAPASLAKAGRRSLLWYPPGAWSRSLLCLGFGLRGRRRAPAGRGPPSPGRLGLRLDPPHSFALALCVPLQLRHQLSVRVAWCGDPSGVGPPAGAAPKDRSHASAARPCPAPPHLLCVAGPRVAGWMALHVPRLLCVCLCSCLLLLSRSP